MDLWIKGQFGWHLEDEYTLVGVRGDYTRKESTRKREAHMQRSRGWWEWASRLRNQESPEWQQHTSEERGGHDAREVVISQVKKGHKPMKECGINPKNPRKPSMCFEHGGEMPDAHPARFHHPWTTWISWWLPTPTPEQSGLPTTRESPYNKHLCSLFSTACRVLGKDRLMFF